MKHKKGNRAEQANSGPTSVVERILNVSLNKQPLAKQSKDATPTKNGMKTLSSSSLPSSLSSTPSHLSLVGFMSYQLFGLALGSSLLSRKHDTFLFSSSISLQNKMASKAIPKGNIEFLFKNGN